jgi:SAM-dependent methyltransferase
VAEWFEEWFGEEYLELYPHRDDREAERAVALVRRTLPWAAGWRVLDVGCGAGRHARALAAAGARPVGLDLSRALLARARLTSPAPLVRADMRRIPVRAGAMDLTVNLFTSFGYFSSDEEHREVVAEMVGTVRPGGWFVLDFLDADTVRARLVPEERLELPAGAVDITRAVSDDGCYVIKTIAVADGRTFVERVRLFTPAELETMLAAAGLEVRHRFGDYDGGPLTAGAPRAILMGQPAAAGGGA